MTFVKEIITRILTNDSDYR